MDFEKIVLDLYINGCEMRKNEPLSNHTNFRIGGVVPYFIIPRTKEAFVNCIKTLKSFNIDYKILGGGANLIVKEGVLKFCVISTQYLTNIEKIKSESNYKVYNVEVGIPITRLSYIAYENELTGMEFASGIPGTLGGALFMNAGAYDGETKNIIESVEVYDLESDNIKTINKDEMDFKYRYSKLQEGKYIALSANIKLEKEEKYKIKQKIEELSEKRWLRQPLDMPSAGSIFKRPAPDFYVGTTIDKLGLKGYSVGDAQVSTKHAGFIINKGNATYEDVMGLIHHIQNIIKLEFKIDLQIEPEIWE